MHDALPPLVLATFLLFGAAPAMAQDFPRQGYDGAPNGQAEPFAGTWGMKFPEPEGTIVSAIIVDCGDPIRIEAVDPTHIRYLSPEGGSGAEFEVFEFEGRTTWLPPNAQSYITVWLDSDSFHLHTTNMGRADWNDPRLLFRCPPAG